MHPLYKKKKKIIELKKRLGMKSTFKKSIYKKFIEFNIIGKLQFFWQQILRHVNFLYMLLVYVTANAKGVAWF